MGRVLIARFHSLGDVVLATGIAHHLKGRAEAVEVVTESRFHPLFEGVGVDRIWSREEIAQAGRFDQVYDLQANRSSMRCLARLGPARRNRSRSFLRRALVVWGRRGGEWPIPHAVLRYAEAAEIRDVSAETLRPRVVATERDSEEARRLPRSWEAAERGCVGLAIGASRRMKRWPIERFIALSDALAARGIETLRFEEPNGCAREADRVVAAPLRPLKALLARCKALVTNDSGVMHLAVGLGTPVVAIFGSTTLDFGFGPLGEEDRVVQRDLPCRPCAVHGARFCWQGHGRCLREIGIDDLLGGLLELLGRREDGLGS